MSLRSVGDQLLQTAPSLLLVGASNVSVSFWVRANSGNDVVATGGVEILGDAGGKFSATLSGTGGLQLQWSSNDGRLNGVSTCTLTLMPGTSYHVASTWQSGSQLYYLNGVEVQSDWQVGSLGVLGDSSPHPFRLGSDQTGTDVTLDQPTFWVGYLLTAQDVVNLRNRTIQPGAIASASIALEWSLAGSDGVAAKVGDAGLADTSPNGLAFSSIVGAAPTYQGGDLTYVATPSIGKLAVAPSGKSILLVVEDGTGVDASITNIAASSEVQSIALTSLPAGRALTLSFGGQTTASIPAAEAPPFAYGSWTFPTVAGHTYVLGVDRYPNFFTSVLLIETLDENGDTVARYVWDYGTTPSDSVTDPGVDDPGGPGYLTVWYITNPGITATGTSMQVRFSGANDAGAFSLNAIRVQDVTASTITYYSVGTTPSNLTQVYAASEGTSNNVYGGTTLNFFGYGGPTYPITGGASALQSALESLSNIGAGNVSVADQSTRGTSLYQVTFIGALTNQSEPLITCADPAVTIAEVTHGGNYPALSINGGAPIYLTNALWVTAGDCPAALLLLPQSVSIGPGDSAMINFPANWLTTSAGPLPATAAIPVSPPSRYTILPPFVAGSKTMKSGYNVEPANYFTQFISFSNLVTMGNTGQGSVAVIRTTSRRKSPSNRSPPASWDKRSSIWIKVATPILLIMILSTEHSSSTRANTS